MFCIFCLFVIISSYSNAYLSKVFSKLSHKNNLLSFSATVEEVSAKETEVVVARKEKQQEKGNNRKGSQRRNREEEHLQQKVWLKPSE